MRGARRRLATLERKCEPLAAGRDRITRIEFEIVDFPGWDKARELGYEPGDDHPWLRKLP
jgi:hypothetical protein